MIIILLNSYNMPVLTMNYCDLAYTIMNLFINNSSSVGRAVILSKHSYK